MDKASLPLSVVYITRNEQHNLPRSLASIQNYAREIIVVDMQSEDATREIAAAYGARVFDHPLIPRFDQARIMALENTIEPWILVLDADEVPSPGLLHSMADQIRANQYDVVEVPRANMALSGFAPHESGFPEYHPRLFRKECALISDFDGLLHHFFSFRKDSRFMRLPADFPDHCLWHFGNPTMEDLLNKLNHYTTVEAAQFSKARRSDLLIGLLWRPFKAFASHYFKRRGFLDGWRGLWLSLFFFTYEWIILVKRWERRLHGETEVTTQKAQTMMEDLIRRNSHGRR